MQEQRRVVTFKNLFIRRPIVRRMYPELFEVFSLPEVLLLCTLDYFIDKQNQQTGDASWNCSLPRLRTKFLPFFSRATFFRHYKKLKEHGIILSISNSHSTTFSVNYDKIVEIIKEKKFHSRSIDDKVLQFETKFSSELKDQEKQEKKENSNTRTSKNLRERQDRRDFVQSETRSAQSETKSVHFETKDVQFETEFLDQHSKVYLPEEHCPVTRRTPRLNNA